jgi:hypothetical protein
MKINSITSRWLADKSSRKQLSVNEEKGIRICPDLKVKQIEKFQRRRHVVQVRKSQTPTRFRATARQGDQIGRIFDVWAILFE